MLAVQAVTQYQQRVKKLPLEIDRLVGRAARLRMFLRGKGKGGVPSYNDLERRGDQRRGKVKRAVVIGQTIHPRDICKHYPGAKLYYPSLVIFSAQTEDGAYLPSRDSRSSSL